MATRTSFVSDGDQVAAWLTVPERAGSHPIVVLVHGGGATHEMMLDQYERWFSGAGLAVLAFDFRHLGESGGQPRQLVSPRRYARDIDAALAFVKSRPELDADRTALWGTSFGASHVVAAAARHPELAAAVVQCPVLNGRAIATRAGLRHLARFTLPIAADLVRAASGRPRRYVPLVGRPGELAFVNQPGALEGWSSVCPPGYEFDNRVAAAAGLEMLFYNASAHASRVRCPLLVCQSDRENLIDPQIAVKVATSAPRGVLKHYDADHFTVYHPPMVERLVADQIEFLTTHLGGAEPAVRPVEPA
ncbi:alpha/beta fold hydrolase [Actinomadura vinacea]|uniref:Alpha/beta fold hydrolase n=1 Tax=Actinomadura vinacea TaxID=115336 RepID=A0ABP5WNE7_9ACTN